MQSYRLDAGLTIKSQETSAGHLRFFARIGRANYPLVYWNQDGSKRVEMIKPEHLFSKQTIDSFKMAPFTQGHPSEPVTSENVTKYIKGAAGHSVVIDGDFLGIVGTIYDQQTKLDILSGKTPEVSPGYLTKLDASGDGSEQNPFFQLGRECNHLASVSRGRHGSEVRFQVDSVDSDIWIAQPNPDAFRSDLDEEFIDSILSNLDNSTETVFNKSVVDLSTIVNSKGATMPVSIPVGKRVFNVDGADGPELASSVVDLLTRIDELESEKTSTETELASVKAELVTVKTESSRLDGLLEVTTQKLTEAEKRPVYNADAAQAEMAEQMAERIELWSTVLPAIRKDSEDFQPDFKLDSVNIQRLYLLSQKPELKDNNRFNSDSGYVAGLFEALKDVAVKTDESTDSEERADEQDNISNSLLEMIQAARKDSANTVEGERSDIAGGANYASGSGAVVGKEDPIAKRRKERSMKPVREAMA